MIANLMGSAIGRGYIHWAFGNTTIDAHCKMIYDAPHGKKAEFGREVRTINFFHF